MNLSCSIYKTSSDNTSTNYVEVKQVLNDIKDGKWEKEIEAIRSCKTKTGRSYLKKAIPAVTFSGTFESKPAYVKSKGEYHLTSRRDDHLLEYSGLLVIDIDNITSKEFKRIKKMCSDDMFLYACFESPSGYIKMLYEVDALPENHRGASFEQVKEYVEAFYGVEVDKSGKNVSRLCYVSYDPDMYINEDYVCVVVDVENYEAKQAEIVTPPIDYENISTDVHHVWSVAKKWMEVKNQHYVSGNRNEYIHKIACILNRAGVEQNQIIQLIQSNHSINKEMMGELLTTVKGVSTRNRREFGTRPIYDKSKKTLNVFKDGH